MNHPSSTASIIGALFIGAGLALAGFFVSKTIYNSQTAINTATVKGLAEQEVMSDLAVWNVSYTMQAATLDEAYAAANAKKPVVKSFLLDKGFASHEISMADDVYIAEYRDNGALIDKQFKVTVSVTLRTAQVQKVEEARSSLGDLMKEGVAMTNSPPRYMFTKLNDIKPRMLEEATKNAKLAANQFAEQAGTKVGIIKSASQGSFSITAADQVDDYGTDTSSLNKKVRVVTTITFYLTE